ncbi:DUF4868 domain-containing protein [Pantoea agglomerans]|uniref:DUF4868 domain-containing protein n=1 Tax=Enterobacter agglomerans TaxID=549 RepID=UPI00202D3F5E|nr:DUF4868 domain-containing protein [Pantoea agglomerans]MCL6409949.1 DUF4868 domain-containing protein [Pantoea agglomerans]
MALFALVDKPGSPKILRIQLDKTASADVDTIFDSQTKHFEAHHSTKIPYYAGYTPRYNECFEIDNFVDSTPLFDAVSRPTAYDVWDPSKLKIDYIKALFVEVPSNSTQKKIGIQTFTKKQILDTSKSFVMGIVASKSTFSKAANIGFNIDDKLVAIIEANSICFQSFFKLRSVFNMSSYFAEATDQDIDDFTQKNVFILPQNFDLKKLADTVVRSKVTLINKTGALTPKNIPKFIAEAKKVRFQLETKVVNGQELIVIPSKLKDIKELLDFLEEDIFLSGISGKRYKAGSKRPI